MKNRLPPELLPLEKQDASAFIEAAQNILMTRMKKTFEKVEDHRLKGGQDPMRLGLDMAICSSANAIVEKLQDTARDGKIRQGSIAACVQDGMARTIREHYWDQTSKQRPYLQQLLDKRTPAPKTPSDINLNLQGMVMAVANTYTKELKELFNLHTGRAFGGAGDVLDITAPGVLPAMLYRRLGNGKEEAGEKICDRLLTDILQGPMGSLTTSDDKPMADELKNKFRDFARYHVGMEFFPDMKKELKVQAKELEMNILDRMEAEGFQGDYTPFLKRIGEIASQRTVELRALQTSQKR